MKLHLSINSNNCLCASSVRISPNYIIEMDTDRFRVVHTDGLFTDSQTPFRTLANFWDRIWVSLQEEGK